MTPTTPAGRAPMLYRLEERAIAHGHQEIVVTLAAWRDVVRPAIEREAAQQERERIRAVINAIAPRRAWFYLGKNRTEFEAFTRSMVRAILAEPSDERQQAIEQGGQDYVDDDPD